MAATEGSAHNGDSAHNSVSAATEGLDWFRVNTAASAYDAASDDDHSEAGAHECSNRRSSTRASRDLAAPDAVDGDAVGSNRSRRT